MFNNEFLKYCERFDDVAVKQLCNTIEETLKFLEKIELKYDFEISTHSHFKDTLKSDPKQAENVYWNEIDERVQFVRSLTAIKVSLLLKSLVQVLNSMNFYAAAVLTRSLYENAAVFYKYQWTILSNYSKWKTGEFPKDGLRISSEFEDFLIKFSHGTRNKCLLKIGKKLHGKDAEKWYNDNILDYFDYWAANKDFTSVKADYDYLADMCHPSALSNMMFQTSANQKSNFLHTKFDKGTTEALLDFIPVIASAVNRSCNVVTNGVEQLEKISFKQLV